jgi:hypothetical protein
MRPIRIGKDLCKKSVYKIFYTAMRIFAYLLLSALEYFPTSLGGKGKLENILERGYPASF